MSYASLGKVAAFVVAIRSPRSTEPNSGLAEGWKRCPGAVPAPGSSFHRTEEGRSIDLWLRSDMAVPERIAVGYQQKRGFERKTECGRTCQARDKVDFGMEMERMAEETALGITSFPPIGGTVFWEEWRRATAAAQ